MGIAIVRAAIKSKAFLLYRLEPRQHEQPPRPPTRPRLIEIFLPVGKLEALVHPVGGRPHEDRENGKQDK